MKRKERVVTPPSDELTVDDVNRLYAYFLVGGILRLAVGTISFFRFLADPSFAIGVEMRDGERDQKRQNLP
jgi:hypothetical protein